MLGRGAASEKLLLSAFFVFVFLNNFIGLFPYVFTATSHLTIRLALGLTLWSGYLLLSYVCNLSSSLAHLVPSGTPLPLAPFIVLIELVRNFMRPLTLSIRLAANIVAGHLLLRLIRGPLTGVNIFIFSLLLVAVILIICLEIGVAFIQGYVFITLSSLYIAEVRAPNVK